MNQFENIVKSKSDEELLKMVYEFDLWKQDMLYAIENELTYRGILPTDINEVKQQKIEEEDIILTKGKEASLLGQILGWLTVCGVLGIYIGYNYTFSKVKSKYTNKEYFVYDEYSRKIGAYIFNTSLVVTTIIILYRFTR